MIGRWKRRVGILLGMVEREGAVSRWVRWERRRWSGKRRGLKDNVREPAQETVVIKGWVVGGVTVGESRRCFRWVVRLGFWFCF